MVCYAIPLAAGIINTIRTRKVSKNSNAGLLNIMLFGASVFGVVDHAWTNELFMISTSWPMDLALGSAITACTVGLWGLLVSAPKIDQFMRRLGSRIGILR